MNMIRRENYNFINFTRFICSILVIGIHTSPLQGIEPNLNYFTRSILFRLAVPFFFINSGYFLADKLFCSDKKYVKEYVRKYILEILNIYIFWTIVYTLLNFRIYFGDGNLLKNIILFIARFLFKGAYIQLWYLPALCVSVYLIYMILDKHNIYILFIYSIGFYIFALFGDLYYGLIDNTIIGSIMNIYFSLFGEMFNSFTWGMIFIVSGIIINKYSIASKIRYRGFFTIILFIIFTIESSILKSFDIPKDNCTSISLLFLAPMLFIFVLTLDERFKNIKFVKKYSKMFKDMSLLIYLVHGMFLMILPIFYRKIGIESYPWINLFNFILVSLGSIILSFILMKSNSKLISFIKKPKVLPVT